jgi:hypothetical protein
MVSKYYGKNENPLTLNTLLKDKKGFLTNSGEYIYGSLTRCYTDIKEFRTDTPSALTDTQVQEIKTALDNGKPVVLEIDYNPRTVKADQHFVLCVDYNPSEENDFTIADPLGGKVRSLKDYLGWYKPNARNTIEQYIIYEGNPPVESAGKVLIDKTELANFYKVKEQWIKLVGYLEIGTDPNLTTFEDAQRVIGGFKSRVTDLNNQLTVALADIKNREEQVSRLKEQLLENEKLRLDLNTKLIEALKNSTASAGLYEGRITELQGQVDGLAKEKGALNIKVAQLEVEIGNLKTRIENLAVLSISDLSTLTILLFLVKRLVTLKGGEQGAK